MKNVLTLICLSLSGLAGNYAFGQTPALPAPFGPHLWTATVKVISEDGSPTVGAGVTISYDVPTSPGSDQPTFGEVKGLTDTNGMFTASHTDRSIGLAVVADKPGYYTAHIGYQFYFDEKRWNPTFQLMLKKICKPIPMYVKHIGNIKFPLFNKAIGYDLMVGDWVAPYGNGINTDFLFTENHLDAASGYTFTVSFPNPGDGIQGSLRTWDLGVSGLLSLHEAPTNGYQPTYEQKTMPEDRIYYFRVRTALDDRGGVKSALYGKIYGDFMQFVYYLNPTPNDRNLEFDPKQNLLHGLKSTEEVIAP